MLRDQNIVNNAGSLYSPSPVTSPVKIFEFREIFCLTFLYGSMASRKILVQTTKLSTSLKIPNF